MGLATLMSCRTDPQPFVSNSPPKLLALSRLCDALEPPVNESLIAICQLFLVPLTILFAAVGVANARFVKLLVCLLGVGLAGLWLYRVYLWTGLSVIDRRTAYGLAGSFALCWVLTLLHQIKSSFGGGYDR